MEVLTMLLILGGGFIVTYAVATPLERRRLKRVEREFYANRQELSDIEFLRLVSPSAQQVEFFIGARRAMGELCGTAPEFIHAQDSMRLLLDMQWDGGYLDDVAFYTEEHANVSIDIKRMPIDDKLTFREYITRMAECIQRV